MKESDLQKKCRDLAMMLDWCFFKGLSTKGDPDDIYLKQGRGFTVEYKLDYNKQSKHQVRRQKVLEGKGIPYYVIKSLSQFRDILLKEENKIMICFKDRAFCSRSHNDLHKGSCINIDCDRNLTQNLLEEAREFELPIHTADFKKLDCGYESKSDQLTDNQENKK